MTGFDISRSLDLGRSRPGSRRQFRRLESRPTRTNGGGRVSEAVPSQDIDVPTSFDRAFCPVCIAWHPRSIVEIVWKIFADGFTSFGNPNARRGLTKHDDTLRFEGRTDLFQCAWHRCWWIFATGFPITARALMKAGCCGKLRLVSPANTRAARNCRPDTISDISISACCRPSVASLCVIGGLLSLASCGPRSAAGTAS